MDSVRRLKARGARLKNRLTLDPATAFVDPFHEVSRSVIVLGSARSGTTKLAEALAASRFTRFILEPLNTFRSPVAPPSFAWGDWHAPDDDVPDLFALFQDVLSGRMRCPSWTDRFNASRLATRRVVKSVAGTNLAQWFRAKFPSVPIVYLVRNPGAATSSILRLAEAQPQNREWGLLLDEVPDDLLQRLVAEGPLRAVEAPVLEVSRRGLDPFGRGVMRWCLENYLALTDPPTSKFTIVYYEDLLTDPGAHLAQLGAFTGLDTRRAMKSFAAPSRTDFRRSGDTAVDRRAEWRSRITPGQHDEARRVLEAFGLESTIDR